MKTILAIDPGTNGVTTTTTPEVAEAREENAKLHKIAELSHQSLAWFHYSNAQRLRAELDQLKEGAK